MATNHLSPASRLALLSRVEREAFLAMAEQWVEAALRVEGVPTFGDFRRPWLPEARH